MKRLGKVLFLILALCAYQAGAATYTGVVPLGSYGINGIAGFQVQDLDGGPSKEVVAYSQSRVYVFNSSASLIWTYQVDNLKAVYVSDVNNDGYKETVIAAGDTMNNMEWGNLYILDKDGIVLHAYDRMSGGAYPHILFNSIAAFDSDWNGYEEIVGGSSTGVHLIKDTYDRVVWTLRTDLPIRKVSVYQADSSNKRILAWSDAYLYLIALDGTLVSKYNLSTGIKELKLLDVGSKNEKDVVFVGSDDRVTILDKDFNLVSGTGMVNNIDVVEAFDFNGDGIKELVLGTDNGVYILNSRYQAANKYVTAEAVRGLYYEDWEGDGEKELIFSAGGYVYAVSPKGDLKEKTGVGYVINDLVVDSLEKDNKINLIVSSEKGLSIYEKNKETPAESDARESYLLAVGLLEIGRYDEAAKSAQEALGIYSKLADTANINACQALIEKIRTERNKSMSAAAEKDYQEAGNSFSAGEYEKAKQYLDEAAKIYIELNDTQGIAKCSNLSEEISRSVAEENRSRIMIPDIMDAANNINVFPILSVFLLITILLLLAVLIGRKNEKK